MRITVGRIPLGKVRSQDDQAIQTEFLVLGIPIFPLRSLFTFRDRDGVERSFELDDLHRVSCLCGYMHDLSAVTMFLSLLLSVLVFHDSGYDLQTVRERYTSIALFLPVMGLIALAVYLVCRSLERGSPEEHAKRRALGACVGYNCLPSWPRREVRKQIFADLEQYWSKAHGCVDGEDWTAAVGKSDLASSTRELVFALASYKHSITGLSRDARLEEQAWGAL